VLKKASKRQMPLFAMRMKTHRLGIPLTTFLKRSGIRQCCLDSFEIILSGKPELSPYEEVPIGRESTVNAEGMRLGPEQESAKLKGLIPSGTGESVTTRLNLNSAL
jgi:hypothetical protein